MIGPSHMRVKRYQALAAGVVVGALLFTSATGGAHSSSQTQPTAHIAQVESPWLDDTSVRFSGESMDVSPDVRALAGTQEAAVALEMSEDGAESLRVLSASGSEGELVYDGEIDGVPIGDVGGHLVAWTSLSPSGDRIAYAYNSVTGKTIGLTGVDQDHRVFAVDGDQVYLSDGDTDPRVWSPFIAWPDPGLQVKLFSDDGGLITDVQAKTLTFEVSAVGSKIIANGTEVVHAFDKHYFGTFSPDGKSVLLSDSSSLATFDIESKTLTELGGFASDGRVPVASWTSDNRVLVTAPESKSEEVPAAKVAQLCDADADADADAGMGCVPVDDADVRSPYVESSALGQFGEFLGE